MGLNEIATFRRQQTTLCNKNPCQFRKHNTPLSYFYFIMYKYLSTPRGLINLSAIKNGQVEVESRASNSSVWAKLFTDGVLFQHRQEERCSLRLSVLIIINEFPRALEPEFRQFTTKLWAKSEVK